MTSSAIFGVTTFTGSVIVAVAVDAVEEGERTAEGVEWTEVDANDVLTGLEDAFPVTL